MHKMPARWFKQPIGCVLISDQDQKKLLSTEGVSCVLSHHFLPYTDHNPLLDLLNEHCVTSPQASARIRR